MWANQIKLISNYTYDTYGSYRYPEPQLIQPEEKPKVPDELDWLRERVGEIVGLCPA
jgi:hypothetical protein